MADPKKPETPFSLKDMADDVLGVCRDEKVSEAILGGVSVGSGMAILLGLDHPEIFKAIWYIHKLWSNGLAWTITKGKPSPETS